MTDKDIIKALECCKTWDDCKGCPYCVNGLYTCGEHFDEDVLDLINRQKAEIERLEDLNKCYYTSCQQIAKSNHEIKAEAVKEFADKFKKTAVCGKTSVFRFPYYQISMEAFDNLVKKWRVRVDD